MSCPICDLSLLFFSSFLSFHLTFTWKTNWSSTTSLIFKIKILSFLYSFKTPFSFLNLSCFKTFYSSYFKTKTFFPLIFPLQNFFFHINTLFLIFMANFSRLLDRKKIPTHKFYGVKRYNPAKTNLPHKLLLKEQKHHILQY